jgi:hypothetical protein
VEGEGGGRGGWGWIIFLTEDYANDPEAVEKVLSQGRALPRSPARAGADAYAASHGVERGRTSSES